MNRQEVESSVVKSVGYDPFSWTLEIEFRTGEVRQYIGVPEKVFRELVSGSVGRYFQSNVRSQYRQRRIEKDSYL